MQDKKFSLNELLALRQWFSMWQTSMSMKLEFVNKARDAVTYIDKILWSDLISNDTPWGTVITEIKDEHFEETIQELFGNSDETK